MGSRKNNWLLLCLLFLLTVASRPTFLADGSPRAVSVPEIVLPRDEKGFKFAVIGDSGTGGKEQYGIAHLLAQSQMAFAFDTVLMMGDNLYGSENPADYQEKFEIPYKPLLDAGVKFYAVLGNHDEPAQRFFKPFNMDGRRFYTFQPKDGIRFFALDSTYMSSEQLDWVEKELRQSNSGWKMCFFHHPIYSSGRRHGSDLELRAVLEPLFVKYGVDAVFSGHEHFYERLKPQNGIAYFISGAAGKLRRGNIAASEQTGKGFDRDYSFMLLEISGDEMHFQTIALSGETVDHGIVRRREAAERTSSEPLAADLLEAVAQGDAALLEDLVACGADVNARDERHGATDGFTPLMWAATEGQAKVARRLIDLGAEVDAKDPKHGATALMRATDNGRIEVARILVRNGADVNARDKHGWTALMGSARQSDTFMVDFLLEHGAQVNMKRPMDGTDALMYAVEGGSLATVERLVAAGADTRSSDTKGRTALMRAVEMRYPDLVRALLAAQANPRREDRQGTTAVERARRMGDAKLLHVPQESR